MAMLDLANYDILDLLCTSFMTDEERGKYIYDYMNAFASCLAEMVAGQFTDEDDEVLQAMLLNPETTPSDVERFYKNKIPNYDSYLLAVTLKFKKEFLLDFYKGMLEESTKQQDPSVSHWVRLVAAAEDDDWNKVAELINQISQQFLGAQSPPVTSEPMKN